MAKTGKGAGRQTKQPAKDATPIPDAAIVDLLRAMVDDLSDPTAETDLERAQEKAFDAMEAPNRRKRIALAREALAISPLCADGYFLLAREAAGSAEALRLYRQAVEAGAQALGEAAFTGDVGDFWGLIETRPYMRARHGLAEALWDSGARDEAVTHYQEMLRLNPNDNQGIRYCLIDALLALSRDDEAGALLKRYEEDASAAWAWSAALLSFRRAGDDSVSRAALAEAVTANPHVPDYLLGRRKLPRTLPDFVGLGDVDEAVAYVHGADAAWRPASGAKAWVAAALAAAASAAASPEDDRIDAAVLALLVLGLHDDARVWKSFDWEAMNRLHAKGLISDPVGRAKSVALTKAGLAAAEAAHAALLAGRLR